MKYITLLFIAFNSFAINLQQFSRSNSVVFETIEDSRMEKSHVYHDYDWLVNLGFSYVDSPLTVKTPNNTQQIDRVIKNMFGVHLGLSWYVKNNFQIGIQSYFSQFEDINNKKHTGFGDIDLRLKWRFFQNENNAFSLMPNVIIPSKGGSLSLIDSAGTNFGSDSVLSDRGFGYGARLIYDRYFKYFQFAFNLGILINDKAIFIPNNLGGQYKVDYTRKLQIGAGAYIPLGSSWGINLEWMKHFSNPLINKDINPNELFLGTSFGMTSKAVAFAGVSLGNLLKDTDGNDWRAVLGIKLLPRRGSFNKNLKKEIHIINSPLLKEKKDCAPKLIIGDSNAFNLLFEKNAYYLKESQKRDLDKIANIIIENVELIQNIEIYGHTSNRGDYDYNYKLGINRARTVLNFLKFRGISEDLFTHIDSKGENSLVYLGEDQNDHRMNRRVEVLINIKKQEFQGDC